MASRVISAVLTLRDQNFSANASQAANNMSDLERGVRSAGNQINAFGQAAGSAFKTVATSAGSLVATGIGALGVAAGAAIVEMDSAFGKLQAQTGVTDAQLKGLESTVKEVYKNGYGESITQVANDLAVLKQNLGDVDAKTLESAEILGQLNEGFDIDSLSRALRSMKSSFPGATEQKSMDLITKITQTAGDASGDLLDTFNEYSGVVSAAGIDMKSFGNIMVNGVKGGARNFDVVADTLKEFNILGKSSSEETLAAYKKLGMNGKKVAADLAAGGERGEKAYYDTMKALSKLDDKSKYATGVALMGTKFEDLEAKTIEAMGVATDQLGNFDGATVKAGEAMQNNFGTKMEKVWRDLKIGVAEVFQDNGGPEMLAAIATKAQEMVPIVLDGLVTIKDTFVAVKDGAMGVYGFFKDNWGAIGPVVYGVAGAILFLKTATTVASVAMKVWKGVTTAMTIAQALFNGTLALSPLGWVAIAIGAVIAVGVLLYKNWDTVSATAKKLWDKTKEVFGGIYDWGVSKIQPVVDFFKGLGDKFNDFKKAISNFKPPEWVSKIGGAISGAASKIKGLVNGSHATGLNSVPRDGYIAELHKGEMVIPARQSERIRAAGGSINNVDQMVQPTFVSGSLSTPVGTSQTSTSNKGSVQVIIQNLNAKGITVAEVINEFVPQLKQTLANM
ncbi:phage tail tape measure protein [Cytobacillus praedii]|uniref:phage tail tape measure protein n=1 Tax=Cytobacillus praedii TaxID=1742358 RepID=UPI002E223897|nr:hypothetical protein [Cytobacillus praedii]